MSSLDEDCPKSAYLLMYAHQLNTFEDRKLMAEIEWKPLPPLWPLPAEFADVGECILLVFTQDSVPTWEVRIRSNDHETDLMVAGTADTFEAAKAAAHFEAFAHAKSSRSRRA